MFSSPHFELVELTQLHHFVQTYQVIPEFVAVHLLVWLMLQQLLDLQFRLFHNDHQLFRRNQVVGVARNCLIQFELKRVFDYFDFCEVLVE